MIRDLAIGRKNWVQVMSEAGGKRTAILLSIIATCKLNNINPIDYLKDVLLKIAIRPEDASVSDLTPVEWLKTKTMDHSPKNNRYIRPKIKCNLTGKNMRMGWTSVYVSVADLTPAEWLKARNNGILPQQKTPLYPSVN